jgi:predicted RNA-binding protein
VRYWIISLPREDMANCMLKGIFGFKRSLKLSRVKEGDGVICYVSKESKVIGFGTVVKPYYKSNSKVFLAEGAFEHRFDVRTETLTGELDFRTLIDEMHFIDNPSHWGLYLRLGIAEIPKRDWDLIKERASEVAKT